MAVVLVAAALAAACSRGPTEPVASATPPTTASTSSTSSSTTSTTAPTTTSTTTAPPPARVLVVGDSFMFDAQPALETALRSAGVDVELGTVFRFGLSDPDYWDWRAQYPPLVERTRPDVVLMFVGSFDLEAEPIGGRLVRPVDPGWAAWYDRLLDEAAALLTAGGARLYWLTVPKYTIRDYNEAVPQLNAALARLAGRNPAVELVDVAAVLDTPEGGFTITLPGPDGRPEQVRKDDGVHLCPAGARRVTEAVVAKLRADTGLAVDGAWRDGPWRADPRYVKGLEGGRCG